MPSPISPLRENQTFCFSCSPQVACFNACCRDLNQVLTPYDVVCLKRFLKMSSTDFLNRYTIQSTGPATGLPVVSLRFQDAVDRACPFVSEAGCRVYPARPASCRTYPLARGVSRNRETGALTEQWALIREPHCLGFENGQSRTVDDWVADQQLSRHNRINDMMLELLSLKVRFHPVPLQPANQRRIYTALYDLDAFVNHGHIKDAALATIDCRNAADDAALLKVAIDWVRDTLLADYRETV